MRATAAVLFFAALTTLAGVIGQLVTDPVLPARAAPEPVSPMTAVLIVAFLVATLIVAGHAMSKDD